MYHASMKLVLEQASNNNTFKFIEGKFSVADGILSCTWHLIFFYSLLTSGKLKFITSQDYFSNTRNKKSAATVSGCLTTLFAYSFTDSDIVTGFGYLLIELFGHHYHKEVICGIFMVYTHRP